MSAQFSISEVKDESVAIFHAPPSEEPQTWDRAWFSNPSHLDPRGAIVPVLCLLNLAWALTGLAQPVELELESQQARLVAPVRAAADYFGNTVSISGDTCVVGAFGVDPGGAAYVYVREETNWIFQAELTATDDDTGDSFGASVSIEGEVIAIGAPGDDEKANGAGAVYIFTRSGTNWTQRAKLMGTDGAAGDGLGTVLKLSGGTVAAGAPYKNSYRGAVYVFVGGGDVWTQQRKITEATVAQGEYFGEKLTMDGDTIAVGVYRHDLSATKTYAGSVYVYVRSGTSWSFQQRLAPDDVADQDFFGRWLDIDGDTIIASSPGNDDNGSYSGSSYVFVRNGTTWSQQIKLTAPDAATGDEFGRGLAIDGNFMVLGAYSDDDQGKDAGSAYLYEGSGATWRFAKKIYAGDPAAGDLFAQEIDLSGQTIVLGADRKDGARGAAYVFVPGYGDQPATVALFNKYLYYPDADASGPYNRDLAAFRYQALLYGMESNNLRARFESMTNLYTQAERDRAQLAEDRVWTALGEFPDSTAYQNLLLDIYYDRAVAETILAKDVLAQADRARLNPPGASGFVIDSEIGVYEQALPLLRNAMQPYFDLLQRDLFRTRIEPQTRWATEVLDFSSEFSPTSWSAAQTLGEPDTYPLYGDYGTAWASATSDGQREFLELGYDNAAPINAVSIYETLAPGAVDLVQVRNPDTAAWQTVWSGTAGPAGDAARIFEVTFPETTFPVNALRVELNSPVVPDWNEIDAVGITGNETVSSLVQSNFGYHVFQTQVPARALMSATYTNANGDSVPVSTNATLFTGDKDLVLLFNVLRDYGRTVTELATLKWKRGDPGDLEAAQSLITDAQRSLLVQGQLLKGIFPTLPPNDDPSGLAQAIQAWGQTLSDLETLAQQISGGSDPLGFSDDFLMLVQKFQGDNPELFDSYNSIKEWLDPSDAFRHLGYAVERLAAARTSYDTYRGFEDQIQDQFEQSTISYEFRLFEIVGARPGEPGYDTPGSIDGSEIWQQTNSIGLARLRILRNQTEIDNLVKQIQIEMNKAASISDVMISYGNRQAQLTEEISQIQAAQAYAQAAADTFSLEKLNPVNIFFNSVNAGVQLGGELAKGQAEAQKERLAAAEQAQITGIESAAAVQTLWLSMKTLALDSQEAVILMKQEVGRLAALLREKAELERRIAERDGSLASRYFADPIHRLRAQYDTQVAHLAFDEAQKWLFFMVRALDYKWNQPFTHSFEGRLWNERSLYKLRNADELLSFYRAMDDYDSQLEGTRLKDDFYDWFSVREDFMGYRLRDDQGNLLLYADPITGEPVDATHAFRSRLQQALDSQQQIRLSFSTVRQIPGGTFFRGARYLPDGEVDPAQRGLYLDKIRWMKIRLPGQHNPNRNRTFITGSLTYAGTSYLRNEVPGYFDPEHPDRLVNDMTSYSTRFWFQSSARTNSLPGVTNLPPRWQFREALSHPAAQMWLTDEPRQNGIPGDPDPLPTVQQIDAFKERSVAATDWRLIIPTIDLGKTILSIDELDDIEIYFYHYAVIRP